MKDLIDIFLNSNGTRVRAANMAAVSALVVRNLALDLIIG
jgi:hypothetical protein